MTILGVLELTKGDDVVFIQIIQRIQRKELCVLELTKGTDVVFTQIFQRIQRKAALWYMSWSSPLSIVCSTRGPC